MRVDSCYAVLYDRLGKAGNINGGLHRSHRSYFEAPLVRGYFLGEDDYRAATLVMMVAQQQVHPFVH